MWIVGGLGFLGSLMAFAFSFIPPDQISVGSPEVYVGILVGSAVVMVVLPFVIYAFRKPHWRDPGSQFVPFTWQLEHTHPGVVNESSVSTADLSQQALASGAATDPDPGGEHATDASGAHARKPGRKGDHQPTVRPRPGPAVGGSSAP